MTLRVHNMHHSRLEHFLQGGIIGSSMKGPPGVANKAFDLVGKTLIFTAPAGVVTFVAPAPPASLLSPQDVKAQIEAQIAALKVTFPGHSLAINLATPAIGVNLNSTGTANSLLGMSKATITLGTFYNPPGGGAPELVSVGQVGDGYLQVITDE